LDLHKDEGYARIDSLFYQEFPEMNYHFVILRMYDVIADREPITQYPLLHLSNRMEVCPVNAIKRVTTISPVDLDWFLENNHPLHVHLTPKDWETRLYNGQKYTGDFIAID